MHTLSGFGWQRIVWTLSIFSPCLTLCLATSEHALADVTTSPLDVWAGQWKGPCEARLPAAVPTLGILFTLDRTVEPIPGSNRYKWKSDYRMPGHPDAPKDYEIYPVEVQRGHFRIDEKNGIEIDAFLSHDSLYTHFQVGDATIVTTDRLESDGKVMIVDLLTFTSQGATNSGGVGAVPAVRSDVFQVNHRCVLQKIVIGE